MYRNTDQPRNASTSDGSNNPDSPANVAIRLSREVDTISACKSILLDNERSSRSSSEDPNQCTSLLILENQKITLPSPEAVLGLSPGAKTTSIYSSSSDDSQTDDEASSRTLSPNPEQHVGAAIFEPDDSEQLSANATLSPPIDAEQAFNHESRNDEDRSWYEGNMGSRPRDWAGESEDWTNRWYEITDALVGTPNKEEIDVSFEVVPHYTTTTSHTFEVGAEDSGHNAHVLSCVSCAGMASPAFQDGVLVIDSAQSTSWAGSLAPEAPMRVVPTCNLESVLNGHERTASSLQSQQMPRKRLRLQNTEEKRITPRAKRTKVCLSHNLSLDSGCLLICD